MRKQLITIFTSVVLSIFLLGNVVLAEAISAASQHKPLVVFLVRHAEKIDDGKDPELSGAGKERAALLASILKSTGIAYIHSSDYTRTRTTAAASASRLGLEVELYNPRELAELLKKIRNTGGRHLVVGHSTTTPAMVELLGADAGQAISEDEYDRLNIVTIGNDGVASSVMMHYGKMYK